MKKTRSVKQSLHTKAFLIPNLVTVLGIFCGFLSILSSFKGDFEAAAKYIGFAIVIDGLDGRIARKLNATSLFGREFDSLSDLVAFGVAPSLLAFTWAFAYLKEDFSLAVSFIFMLCTAFRLARFNIAEPSRHFQGLPSPAAAATIASLAYLWPEPLTDTIMATAVMILTATLACFMVTKIQFLSVKHIRFSIKSPRSVLLSLAIIVVLTWSHSRELIAVGCLFYIASGIYYTLMRRKHRDDQNKPDEGSPVDLST